jgi:hypothetical protein
MIQRVASYESHEDKASMSFYKDELNGAGSGVSIGLGRQTAGSQIFRETNLAWARERQAKVR